MKITRSWKKCNIHEIIRQLKPEWFFCRVKHWNCVCQKYSQLSKYTPFFLQQEIFIEFSKHAVLKVSFLLSHRTQPLFSISKSCVSQTTPF